MNIAILSGTLLDPKPVKGGLRFQIRQPVRRATAWTAQYISCVAWDRVAEVIQAYYEEGSAIEVWGNLYSQRWEDPKTGAPRTGVSVTVFHCQSPPRAHPIPLEYEAEKANREQTTGWIPPIEIREDEV